MKTIKVLFANGNIITTEFNGTLKEAASYYLYKKFQFGITEENPQDHMVTAIDVAEVA